MHILLSNDDGILSPGLAALRSAVADLGPVEVVAPASPQSAAGHSITLRTPLTVQRVRVGGRESGFDAFSVDGRPADCVRLAVRSLLAEPVDLVLSGINAGTNVGINVFYSGTVAAAAEAAMLHLPAVAFSAEMVDGDVDFPAAARLCRWVLDQLLLIGLPPGQLVNVNIPALGPIRPVGVKVIHQSVSGLEDFYHRHESADGKVSYKLGDEYRFLASEAESDAACLAEGFITVTPLKVDMTDYARLETLSGHPWPSPPR